MVEETSAVFKLLKDVPTPLKYGTILYFILSVVDVCTIAALNGFYRIVCLIILGAMTAILLLFWLTIVLVLYIKNKPFKKGKILDALVFTQDADGRDSRFKDIDKKVKKTYWVLGSSLVSITMKDSVITRMCSENIKIQLCMMDPDMATDSVCKMSSDTNMCAIQQLMQIGCINCKENNIEKIKTSITNSSNLSDILNANNILLSSQHLDQYYSSMTPYKKRINDAYTSLKILRDKINVQYGANSIELFLLDSFIPMSMTVIDAEEDCGEMIVEFHLPFTQNKVMINLKKKDNQELFELFVDFYKTIYNRAKSLFQKKIDVQNKGN